MDDTENVDRIADNEMHFTISFDKNYQTTNQQNKSLVLHEEIMTNILFIILKRLKNIFYTAMYFTETLYCKQSFIFIWLHFFLFN